MARATERTSNNDAFISQTCYTSSMWLKSSKILPGRRPTTLLTGGFIDLSNFRIVFFYLSDITITSTRTTVSKKLILHSGFEKVYKIPIQSYTGIRYTSLIIIIIINLVGLRCRRRNITYIFIHTVIYKRHMVTNKNPMKLNK